MSWSRHNFAQVAESVMRVRADLSITTATEALDEFAEILSDSIEAYNKANGTKREFDRDRFLDDAGVEHDDEPASTTGGG